MQEIYDNLFQETISYSDRHMSPRNLYLIRQPGRSLMVDTSFRFERDWEILRGMVEALGVSYKELDVFITHDHPDHTGLVPALQELGASVYMNPEETRKRADLLHCYLADEESRIQNLRIVGSQQKDLGLLKCYMESLGDMKHRYADCRILPCHYGPVADVEKEANRIILGYLDKCEIMKGILEEDGGLMTTRDVGVRAYGRSQGPPDYRHFVSCTQIWAKTFSCLEFMYGEGLVERCEREGIIYWKRTEGAG